MKKILTLEEAAEISQRMKNKGKKVVLTNGCFDLLHVGHLRYLKDSKKLGNVLIVAVNSDNTIRKLKGPSRPLVSEEERAEMLLNLKPVDYVVIFDDMRADNVINKIKANYWTKGGECNIENIPKEERDALVQSGTKPVFLDFYVGKSTTNLIKKARED